MSEAYNGGGVYVFHRTGGNDWGQGVLLVSPGPESDANFGHTVSLSGDYLIVGDTTNPSSGIKTGAAYIFHRIGLNDWDQGTPLMPPGLEDRDEFGHVVAIDGEFAVVGAPGTDEGGIEDNGVVYAFHRTGTTSWDNGQKIVNPADKELSRFGFDVSISNDTVAIMAESDGAIHAFRRNGANSWGDGEPIGLTENVVGGCLSMVGEFVVTTGHDPDRRHFRGPTALLFERSADTWNRVLQLTDHAVFPSENFGHSLDISATHLAVGVTTNYLPGEVYVY